LTRRLNCCHTSGEGVTIEMLAAATNQASLIAADQRYQMEVVAKQFRTKTTTICGQIQIRSTTPPKNQSAVICCQAGSLLKKCNIGNLCPVWLSGALA